MIKSCYRLSRSIHPSPFTIRIVKTRLRVPPNDYYLENCSTAYVSQPKQLWDILNRKAPLTIILENEDSPPKKASSAALRRGLANNAFFIVKYPKTLGRIDLSSFKFTRFPDPPIEYVLMSNIETQFDPLSKPHPTRFLVVLNWRKTPESIKTKLESSATKVFGDLFTANWVVIHVTDPSLNFLRPAKGHDVENDIFLWTLVNSFVKAIVIVPPRSFAPQYGKIRTLTRTESKHNIFKWQSLCAELSTKSNIHRMRDLARAFGVPPQFWDNPRKVCAIIAPRAQEFLEKVECSNAEEPTMEGDEVGGIPEFLKYTYIADNGKVYCSSIIDLYKAVKSGQTMDPYRRFSLDNNDIIARYEFLQKVLTPQGLGEGVMAKIRDTALNLGVGGQLRARLVHIWGKLRYPKFTIEEIMGAGEDLLNGIFAAISRQQGIMVTGQEKDVFNRALGKPDEKRTALINTMYRIVNIDDPSNTNLIALELSINDATPQGSIRARDEDDDLAAMGTARSLPASRIEEDDEYLEEDNNPEDVNPLTSGQHHLNGDRIFYNGSWYECAHAPCLTLEDWDEIV